MGTGERSARGRVQARPRFRLFLGTEKVFGPGQADLLEAIEGTGSLRAAAARLGMSYMRAWSLAQRMNRAFQKPLVSTVRGGSGHGAATLTDTGRDVLRLYREMETRALEAAAPAARRLARLVRHI